MFIIEKMKKYMPYKRNTNIETKNQETSYNLRPHPDSLTSQLMNRNIH